MAGKGYGGKGELEDGTEELRIVDLARGRTPRVPAWLVRRAAHIVSENREVLDLEELADLAIVLMKEADARLATHGTHVTR